MRKGKKSESKGLVGYRVGDSIIISYEDLKRFIKSVNKHMITHQLELEEGKDEQR